MSEHALNFMPSEGFRARAKDVVENPFLRQSFRGAMDFLINKRISPVSRHGRTGKPAHAGRARPPVQPRQAARIADPLEANLTRNGIQVHWAETPEEANAIILGICHQHAAKLMIKGKSMVSEEIELNHAAEAAGIGALESDMGEYIVQLAGEKPSHIIMPAIHKTKEEIAKLFHEKVPGVDYTDNVDALIQIGRKVLRKSFWKPISACPASISPSPKPAPCAWSKMKATAECAPPPHRCTSPSPASRKSSKSWNTFRRCSRCSPARPPARTSRPTST
jgi:L-lactate dehydrogenase complex protein LldF